MILLVLSFVADDEVIVSFTQFIKLSLLSNIFMLQALLNQLTAKLNSLASLHFAFYVS